MDELIRREILQICRTIEKEKYEKQYKYKISEKILPFLPEFIQTLESVFSTSHILVESLKRYILIDWSEKE